MKVKQDRKFEPITITLENEEEAELLWHLLNIPVSGDKFNYLCEYEATKEEINQFSHNLRSTLNPIHKPKKVED